MPIKRIAILIALLVLISMGCSFSLASTSFKTPEDVITAYIEAVAKSDSAKILQTCAINEMSEKFNFKVYTERLKVLLPSQFLAPAEYPFYVETNKMQLTAQTFNRVKMFDYSLLSREDLASGDMIPMTDNDKINSFLKDVDPKKLSGLKVEKIGLPGKSIMENANYKKNAANLALIYGADESTERIALISLGGNDFYVGFTLLRYGNNWKINVAYSSLAATPVLGMAVKTTVDEFNAMINK